MHGQKSRAEEEGGEREEHSGAGRTPCSGYAECIGIAPEVFALGEDNICAIMDPEADDDESLLDAARASLVDAITVIDEDQE